MEQLKTISVFRMMSLLEKKNDLEMPKCVMPPGRSADLFPVYHVGFAKSRQPSIDFSQGERKVARPDGVAASSGVLGSLAMAEFPRA